MRAKQSHAQAATIDSKRDQQPRDNTEKDSREWVSGSEPMTGTQESYLKTLSKQAHEPQAFDPGLTKAEASQRIDALEARLELDRTGRS